MLKAGTILPRRDHARTPNNANYHMNLWRGRSFRRMTTYVLAVLMLLVQVGTVRSLSHTESGYIQPRSGNATRVLIFVHGFKSSPSVAWNNGDENVYWPRLVNDDTEIGDVDVYVYHFLPAWGPMEIVADMQARLLGRNGVMGYDEIAFVAHSVGGNVVRQFILSNYVSLADRVKFLVFLATPTLGVVNPRVLSLFSKPLNDFLINGSAARPLWGIVQAWQRDTKLNQMPAYCGYESDEYAGWYRSYIVDQGSACRLCQLCYEIQGDHSEIVKPESEESESHMLLRRAIGRNWLGHNR